MEAVIDFDRARWTCCDALINIFFSDWKVCGSGDQFRAEIQRHITAYAENKNCKILRLSESQVTKIHNLVDLVKAETELPLTKIEEAPAVWIKFAFIATENGAAISEKFIRCYARWRLSRTIAYGAETIAQIPSSTSNNRENVKFTIAGHRFLGIPFDQFLFSRTIPLNIGEGIPWKLSARCTSKTKQQRLASVKIASGTNVTNSVAYCLESAATTRKIAELHNTKIQGRFLCDISRKELTIRLMKIYKRRLPYSESSIFRTLSTFVACPRYRLK